MFNETLTINNRIEVDKNKVLKIEELSIKNYFTDYKENKNNPELKVKYDDNGEIESFYTISSTKQYIKMLNLNSLNLYSDNEEKEYDFSTTKDMNLFLKNNKIKNDIDYLNYIKNNYFIKNNIFTSTKTIKNNYLINTFVEVAFPEFESIILINGRIDGYIINLKNINTKEIHILNNNDQYIITLSGDKITNDDFIIELLNTVSFN